MLRKLIFLLFFVGLLLGNAPSGFAQEDINLSQTFIGTDEDLTFNYPEDWSVKTIKGIGLSFFAISNNRSYLTTGFFDIEDMYDFDDFFEVNNDLLQSGEFVMTILPPPFLYLLGVQTVDANVTLEEIMAHLRQQQGATQNLQEVQFGNHRGVRRQNHWDTKGENLRETLPQRSRS